MLTHNRAIGLILVERQKLERFYEQIVERLLKEKKDEAAFALNKAKREDPDLAPLSVFSVLYNHLTNGTPQRFECFGDKTVNGNSKITWAIDADKRLILTGAIQYADSNTVDVLQISVDGRKMISIKSSTGLKGKSATVVTD